MPSFDRETVERWRAARVSETRIPKGLDEQQINVSLSVCEEDLLEEERRLNLALSDAQISRANIRVLRKKRDKLMHLKSQMGPQ